VDGDLHPQEERKRERERESCFFANSRPLAILNDGRRWLGKSWRFTPMAFLAIALRFRREFLMRFGALEDAAIRAKVGGETGETEPPNFRSASSNVSFPGHSFCIAPHEQTRFSRREETELSPRDVTDSESARLKRRRGVEGLFNFIARESFELSHR
jgi:hypothetical protein